MSEEGFRDPPPTPRVEPSPSPAQPEVIADDTIDMPDGGVRYRLRTPVQMPGKGGMTEVTEIICRRPTGADLLAVGNPVDFDPARGKVDHNMDRMPLMIFRLSSVAPPTLGKMTTEDLTGLFWAVTRFFLPPVGSI